MLRPKVNIKEFEKYGFKHCKGIPKEHDCYYLCVRKGVKMLFVSPVMYAINEWEDTDPRIHKNPNCKYKDERDYLDITYDLIKRGMLESEWEYWK